MSDAVQDTPIVNDAITSDDAGFVGDAGDQVIEESSEIQAESSETLSEEELTDSSESVDVQAETVEELQDEIEEAIEDGASEEEIQDMIKEFKIKVNGQEKTVKLDLSNEQEIVRQLQLAAAGQSAMQRTRELEKTYEEEIKNLLQNPFDTLKDLGLNPDELAEQHLRSLVEEQKKSPEQRQQEQLQRELEEARRKLKEQQEAAERAQFEQLQAEAAADLESEIEAALDAHTTLPKSQKTVQRIADTMLWAMESGFEDVKVADVIPTVEDEIRKELHGFMEQLPEDVMEEYIGKKNLEKIRQRRLTQAKVNNTSNIKPTSESAKPKAEPKGKKRQRSKDYFRNLGKN